MGAVPKFRTSRAKRGSRRSHDHIAPVHLVVCPNCRSYMRSHHVCPTCGQYRGNQIIEIKQRTRRTEQ
ncbi:MAG: 50S ribosomal protein L32 [Chloroflexota bacterium]|nr:50S ribosomal protein L32 [Chloroflexota bacterium]